MNWLKYVVLAATKSGRQQLVRELLKEQITVGNIASYAAKGVEAALNKGTESLGEQRCAQIALGATKGGEFCKHLGEAVDPNGEDGIKVSAAELAALSSDLEGAITLLVTQEAIDANIEKAIAYIP